VFTAIVPFAGENTLEKVGANGKRTVPVHESNAQYKGRLFFCDAKNQSKGNNPRCQKGRNQARIWRNVGTFPINRKKVYHAIPFAAF
jgi:hypothetical protein